MKLAVVGSRHLKVDVGYFIALVPGVTEIISGGARGVDQAAAAYAKAKGLPLRELLPDYAQYGKVAPLVRDREIVNAADMVLAIWDGFSRGTAYTIAYAKKQNKPVRIFQSKGGAS